MKISILVIAAAVAAGALFLAGCDAAGSSGSVVIGSITMSYGSTIPEGKPYHVVLYAAGITMNPATDYETAARAFEVTGAFPAPGLGASYDIANYEIDGVAAGEYSAFAWVDSDANGAFDPGTEPYGFFVGPLQTSYTQPAANVTVPDRGLVDVDITVGVS